MSLSDLPSITALLDRPDVVSLVARHGRSPVVDALRAAVGAARTATLTGDAPDTELIVGAAADALARDDRRRMVPVINATGVVLHTNLGRAPLSTSALQAVAQAGGYVSLEYDLETGARGRRSGRLAERLAALTGAEEAAVVNNGAAALVLALTALAGGRDVVVSRGELVEIGGSFRLPDMVAAVGVTLREVGTTNRTRATDYDAAIDASTAAILRVHPSNYRVVGFAERPNPQSLAEVAQRAGVPFVHDVGSGLVFDEPRRFPHEPSVRGALEDGADLVVLSGDKLLGGPQAGILVGRSDLVSQCRSHPLARALRLDKLRLAALEATVDQHLQGLRGELPVWTMLDVSPSDLAQRAERIRRELSVAAVEVSVIDLDGVVGGGAVPETVMRSVGLRLPGHGPTILAALRGSIPPVVGRLADGEAVLDLRTVPPEQDHVVVAAVQGVFDREAPADDL